MRLSEAWSVEPDDSCWGELDGWILSSGPSASLFVNSTSIASLPSKSDVDRSECLTGLNDRDNWHWRSRSDVDTKDFIIAKFLFSSWIQSGS